MKKLKTEKEIKQGLMEELFTKEEILKMELICISTLIEIKKREAENYLDYFQEVEIRTDMQMYAKGKIEAYEEIIKILEERD